MKDLFIIKIIIDGVECEFNILTLEPEEQQILRELFEV